MNESQPHANDKNVIIEFEHTHQKSESAPALTETGKHKSNAFGRGWLFMNGATVIVAAIACYIYVGQENIMQDQLDVMKTENRPWLGSETNIFNVNYDAASSTLVIEGTTYLINAGKTPAFITSGGFEVKICDSTLPKRLLSCITYDKPDNFRGGGRTVVVPGGHYQSALKEVFDITPQELEALKEEKGQYPVLFGQVLYQESASSGIHVTHICEILGVTPGQSADCNVYNDAN
jgi:hypothetical protein